MAEPSTPARVLLQRRASNALPAFVLGIPLAALVIYLVCWGPGKDTEMERYLSHHVEKVEVILFCCAFSALAGKLWRSRREQAAFRTKILPAWDGTPLPVEEGPKLLADLARLPYRLQNSFLVCRVAAILDFVCSRRSADELDDQMRTLADNDAIALEGSYSLTRFITWAIPILGFLGTVLGITKSISHVTPEQLEKDLSQVTSGLALAFDATALGLALTMVTMFLSFLTERAEQGALEEVDRFVDRHLAHRFERNGVDGGEFAAVVRQQTQFLVLATEKVVQRQAEVWSKTFAEVQQSRAAAEREIQQGLTAAIETALERTLETHARRLTVLEQQASEHGTALLEKMSAFANGVRQAGQEQAQALLPLAQSFAAQTEALTRLQEGEARLLQLQSELNQNLGTLVRALQGFEFRVASSEFRVRLEPPEAKPEIRVHRPSKAA